MQLRQPHARHHTPRPPAPACAHSSFSPFSPSINPPQCFFVLRHFYFSCHLPSPTRIFEALKNDRQVVVSFSLSLLKSCVASCTASSVTPVISILSSQNAETFCQEFLEYRILLVHDTVTSTTVTTGPTTQIATTSTTTYLSIS
jgi:hypothetical protein